MPYHTLIWVRLEPMLSIKFLSILGDKDNSRGRNVGVLKQSLKHPTP
jgi:hypothetical protein